MSEPTDTPIVDETPAPAVTPEPIAEAAPAVDWETAFWERVTADSLVYTAQN